MNNRIRPRVLGAIIACGLMSFCGVIVETAMNITFPTLMKEFGVATNTVQWMTTLYLLVVASLVPLSATLKRRFKTRSLFLVAISFFIVGVVLDGLAPQFWLLLLGRAIQGLGTGIALPLMFNIILEQVPRAKIGMMMGLGTLITAIAPAIGPTFGGLVVATMSWRYIFAFLLPLLIVALILGLLCIEQKTPTQAASVDALSVALVIIAFSGLIYGLSQLSWLAGLLGAIALATWCVRSLRITTPIINLRLFANASFCGHVLAFTMIQITALGLSFVLPNYIQLVNHASALQAGLVVLPGAAIGAVLAPLSGRLYDHVGARLPLRLGIVFLLLGVAAMALTGWHMTDGLILFLYLLCMLGMGLAVGNLMTDGLRALGKTQQTDGNAIFNTLQQFAAAIGTSVAAAIIAAAQAHSATLTEGTAAGSVHTLWLLTGLLVLGGIAIVAVTRKHAEKKF